MASDDVVLILPRREAQGLWELLDVGLAPKPKALHDALKTEGNHEEENCS